MSESTDGPELLSPEGKEELGKRETLAEAFARHQTLTLVFGGLAIGAANYVGAIWVGASTRMALTIAVIVAVLCLLSVAVVRVVARRDAVVQPLLDDAPIDGDELDELPVFATEDEAVAEAKRRNMLEGASGAWWIEVWKGEAGWSVEMRGERRRAHVMQTDPASKPPWWEVGSWGGLGGGGGGDGGGGGGGS